VLDAWNEVLPSGQRRGPAALRELPPKEFIEAASRICPKELFMQVTADAADNPLASLSPEEKRAVAMKLYESIRAESAQVIEAVPHDLRTCGTPEADEVKSST
jgi:hypothetical protein